MKKFIFIVILSIIAFFFPACARSGDVISPVTPPSDLTETDPPENNPPTYAITYLFVANDNKEYSWKEYGSIMMKPDGNYPVAAKPGKVIISDLKSSAVVISAESFGTEMDFKGWYLDESCTQKVQNGSVNIIKDTTLYAKIEISSWIGPF